MKPAALHDRIRDEIEGRIMSGEWEAGHRIPRETELMAEYDCSRMTVSKAVDTLVDRGLIARRKRAGSFVTAPTAHRAVLEIPDISAEIAASGRPYGLELLARNEREATNQDQALLAISAGPVLALSCLHLANGHPFALETRLINLTLVPAALAVDFTHDSPGRWLLGHVPWSEAEHRITAIAATPDTARQLGLAEGAPCLRVERWTWRTAARITYVSLIYPGDHALTARFIS